MYYLFENNKICNIEKSKNDEENFSDEAFDKLVEQRHGKIKKKSENVFDLIEVGDLVEGKWRFWQRFIREVVSLANYEEYKIITLDGFVSVSVSNNRENTDKVDAIYKPNKNGDYICVWRRENEEH